MGIVGTRMACGNADDVCLVGVSPIPKMQRDRVPFPNDLSRIELRIVLARCQ